MEYLEGGELRDRDARLRDHAQAMKRQILLAVKQNQIVSLPARSDIFLHLTKIWRGSPDVSSRKPDNWLESGAQDKFHVG